MSMEPVVLDTDVASLSLKGKLPPDMLRPIAGRVPLITFGTLAEPPTPTSEAAPADKRLVDSRMLPSL
ncbi:MAG: hypothetical protein ACRDR6_06340 [Pseudonocardiaceae bacterium]